MPPRPQMKPAVGKSGPGTSAISSSSVASGFSISRIVASMISFRLCGGMLVAMPTAIPEEPCTSRLGDLACLQNGGEIAVVQTVRGLKDTQVVAHPRLHGCGIEVARHQAVLVGEILGSLVRAVPQHEPVIGRASDRRSAVERQLDQRGVTP